MFAFILWTLCCCLLLGIGVSSFFAKKPVGFFANAKPFPVKNVKGYNRACGILFICYSLVCMAAGIPLLFPQNSIVILFSVGGMVIATIALILVYVLVIEKKYRAEEK